MELQSFDVVVIGSGVYGLSATFHLAKADLRVALLQRYTVGHLNGSHYSDTRTYSAAYEKQFYCDLARLSREKYWTQMEEQFGCKLITKTPFIYFDDDNLTHSKFSSMMKSQGKQFEFIEPEQIIKRYPGMPWINTSRKPIIDHNSGLINASLYISKLKEKLLLMPNVAIFENTVVKSIRSNERNVNLETEEDNIIGDKVVVACGKWVKELVPELSPLVKNVKQMICRVSVKNSDMFKYITYPNWEHKSSESVYQVSLNLHQGNIVITQKRDWDYGQSNHDKQSKIMKFKQTINQYFKDNIRQIHPVEEFTYTMTKSNDFIIDWADQNERVLVCSACSGHGFQFAPLMGKIITDLIQEDQSIDIFQKNRYLFRIIYHQGIHLS